MSNIVMLWITIPIIKVNDLAHRLQIYYCIHCIDPKPIKKASMGFVPRSIKNEKLPIHQWDRSQAYHKCIHGIDPKPIKNASMGSIP